jgi:hypothetical protein
VRHVVDELTAPNIAYTIDYAASGPKESADKACASKGEDPQAKAACMEKERAKFVADVLVFEKVGAGLFLMVYKRNGDSLAEVSKSPIEFKNETGRTRPETAWRST